MARKALLIGISLLLICSLAAWAGGEKEKTGTGAEGAATTAAPSAYQESPVLTRMAAEGLIPPLEDRLPVPSDIHVVQPIDGPGNYGGTARVFNAEAPKRPYTAQMLMGSHGPFRTDPDGKPGVPNVYKSYTVNEDFTEWTLYLREGLKFSDGTPLTTENMLLYWKHYRANTDLIPGIASAEVTIEDRAVTFYNEFNFGRTVKKQVVDDYTLRYTADIPYPTLINHLSHPHNSQEYYIVPMHYLMQFHPDEIGEDAAQALADRAGFDTWFQLFLNFSPIQGQQTTVQVLGNFPPSLSSYVSVDKSQTTIIWERNPYYYKVDTEGKQLPYIDKIVVEHVPQKEIINGKIISGEVDFEGFMTTTPDIPLFRRYEEQGDYHTDLWNFAASATVFHPNYAYEDEVVAKLFQTKEFRQALALSIDRNRINDEILFGQAKPVRMTVLPNTIWFKPEYETRYADYDPDRAMRMLDELGVTDKDGDGWRDDPDGNPINWAIEYIESEAPRTPIAELTKENWREIGLNVDVQLREATLGFTRGATNAMAMWIWHGDARTETLFPAYINSHIFGTWIGQGWYDYYTSGGEVGVQPPDNLVNDVFEAFKKMERATSREEFKKWGQVMLDSAMENVWTLGTCSNFPHPMIVKNDLKNFPTEEDGPLLYIWSTWWTNAYEPAQFYFENRPQVTYEESMLPDIYPVEDRGDPVSRAIEAGWL